MKAEITIMVEAPTECSEEAFREWLEWKFQLGCEIKLTNPLVDYEIDRGMIESDIKIL